MIESLLLGVATLLVLVPWYAIRPPIITALIGGSVRLYLAHGPIWMATALVTLASVLIAWRLTHRLSFARFVSRPVRSKWRSVWGYRSRWRAAMHMCGLSKGFGAKHYAPHIVRVRSHAHGDQVRVRLLMGQRNADFEAKADELASTFGALSCRGFTSTAIREGNRWQVHCDQHPHLRSLVPLLARAVEHQRPPVAQRSAHGW